MGAERDLPLPELVGAKANVYQASAATMMPSSSKIEGKDVEEVRGHLRGARPSASSRRASTRG